MSCVILSGCDKLGLNIQIVSRAENPIDQTGWVYDMKTIGTIIQYLFITQPSFGFSISIIAIALFFSIPLLGQYFISSKVNEKLNKKVNDLDDKLGIIYDKTKTFANAVSQEFPALNNSNHFKDAYQELNYIGKSPVALTDKGKKVADNLNVQDTVEEVIPTILKLLPNDPTVLDVQNVCFAYALDDLLKNADRKLKQKIDREIYQDGGNSKNTLMVYGIMFRDAIFIKLSLEG